MLLKKIFHVLSFSFKWQITEIAGDKCPSRHAYSWSHNIVCISSYVCSESSSWSSWLCWSSSGKFKGWLYLWINPHMDLFTICVNVNLNCVVFNLYREHVSRSFLANQSLKILEQLNWLLHFLVLLWKSTMMLSRLLHFLITLSLWITLKVEQINSWQWLLFKAWWKTTRASQLLRRCVSLFPLLTQFLLFLNISKHVCRLRCYSN